MSSETVNMASAAVLTRTVPGTGSAPLANQKKVALPDMPAPERPKLPERDIEQQQAVAAQLDSFVQSSGRDLSFAYDPGSKRTVVTVRDAGGSVIRQIPDPSRTRVAAVLEGAVGTMFDGKA
jgi:uncharacterized FlaG/YvyC family protein